VVHVLWGGLLSWLFGFSFTVLRVGTLVLSVVACTAVYGAARALGASRPLSTLAAFLLLASPLYFSQTYSFMTDVPFVASIAIAGWAYLRASATRRLRYVLLGTTVCAVAFLIRQFSIFVTAAFVIAYAWEVCQRRTRLSAGVVGAVVTPWIVALAVYATFIAGANEKLATDTLFTPAYVVFAAAHGIQHWAAGLYYLGLGVAPVFLGVLVARNAGERGDEKIPVSDVALVALAIVVFAAAPWGIVTTLGGDFFESIGLPSAAELGGTPYRLPLMGNALEDTGFGPIISAEPVEAFHITLGGLWWIPTAFCALAAGWWILASTRKLRHTEDAGGPPLPNTTQLLFLVFWFWLGLIFSYNPARGWGFDRYLLTPHIPAILMAVVFIPSYGHKLVTGTSFAVVLALLVFSMASLRDYFVVHAMQNRAYHRVVNDYGAARDTIDAGYALNGYYLSRAYRRQTGKTGFGDRGAFGHWMLQAPRYKILVGEPPEPYEQVFSDSFTTWLGGREVTVTAASRSLDDGEAH
jgi:hypothetical protein